tara:strand:+ start:333 stop:506 length:174 start_codon:yes stop_codon:yes gene_type:complete
MSEANYSINEILKAVNEINKGSKSSEKQSVKNTSFIIKSEIPTSTLKIIEEAEKNKS